MSTEEVVAPLDAYATAKPDEPTFTLQGGDPLAPALVKLWALAARCRSGIISVESFLTKDTLNELTNATIRHSVADDDRERDNLLVRATAAEQVSWEMDAYRKGDHATDNPTEAADTHLTELERIDLHDLKVRCAGKFSNFRCEIHELREALFAKGYRDEEMFQRMGAAMDALQVIQDAIEPRRLFRKD
jgi:hypothetical protein